MALTIVHMPKRPAPVRHTLTNAELVRFSALKAAFGTSGIPLESWTENVRALAIVRPDVIKLLSAVIDDIVIRNRNAPTGR